ncbi:MAG: DUF1896 domain-containing protein [Candidatus Amulumruptor caecigallinarius]|nr:DUF1896 domain-containing protein [Candidatus Amulumruptor caecigallinarius]MCM1397365.1 DUF1896 domain-containing protein [Candidatus Amulumruptor caecigallinarius]MCM1453572.1 DUF1896 domain-containing protein [bacterium]
MATAAYVLSDYFRDYFIRFIAESGYSLEDFPTTDIDARCEAAWDTFERDRRDGAPLHVAEENAIAVLVDRIGTPGVIYVTEVLLDNFAQLLEEDNERLSATVWAQTLVAEIPSLFDGVPSLETGVDPYSPDSSRQLVIGRIAQYLEDNGIR